MVYLNLVIAKYNCDIKKSESEVAYSSTGRENIE